MEKYYLFIDAETGGLTTDTSLLSISFILTDSNFKILEDIYSLLYPLDKKFVVTSQALEINKIDLKDVIKDGIEYSKFMQENLIPILRRYGPGVVPVGYNLNLDLNFIYRYLLSKEDFEKYCTHRSLDIASYIRFQNLVGEIKVYGGLENVTKYYKIANTGSFHNARNDNLLTLELTKLLVEKAKNKKE